MKSLCAVLVAVLLGACASARPPIEIGCPAGEVRPLNRGQR